MERSNTIAGSLTLVRVAVTALFVCAIAGLAITSLVGFEEPNDVLLILSSSLLLIGVLIVFAHLLLTRLLDRWQKRRWFHQLTGRKAVSAWSEYLSCDDLRA